MQVREFGRKGDRIFFFFLPNNKIAFSEKLFHGRLAVFKADAFEEMKLPPKPSVKKESKSIGQLLEAAQMKLGSIEGMNAARKTPGQLRTH